MHSFKVVVDQDLEDLIPSFLQNRANEIIIMKSALNEDNFEQIRIIGHSMKGFGSGYGFDFVSEVGKELEMAAQLMDREIIINKLIELENYFSKVTITYK